MYIIEVTFLRETSLKGVSGYVAGQAVPWQGIAMYSWTRNLASKEITLFETRKKAREKAIAILATDEKVEKVRIIDMETPWRQDLTKNEVMSHANVNTANELAVFLLWKKKNKNIVQQLEYFCTAQEIEVLFNGAYKLGYVAGLRFREEEDENAEIE